eukprot:TRINITY_DN12046_c0_g1_i1.p1 TRINITY_DN12046_c0_g1~~TRINITY_DN12046_c0_g1_i1.p1  ORF type:complete len:260 (-),score=-1.85 TRINITY_DN12046_c0_g1_i1:23-733(-)
MRTRMQLSGGFKRCINSKNLFSGISSVAIGAGPAHALYFLIYESVFRKLPHRNSKIQTSFNSSIAAIVSTCVSDAFMNPWDVVKQRMQIKTNTSLFETGYSMLKNEGIRAFFISYPTTLFMNIPFVGINFGVYMSLKTVLCDKDSFNIRHHLFAGCISGGIAGALTTPFDVVKTFLQLQPKLFKSQNCFTCMKTLVLLEGSGILWRGLVPRTLFFAPAASISWGVYELLKHILGAN